MVLVDARGASLVLLVDARLVTGAALLPLALVVLVVLMARMSELLET